jgi:rubrerythrin
MNDKETLPLLESLAQLDIDAGFAYRRAIAAIEIPDIRRELAWAWRDHERHVEALGAEIRRLGGKTPSNGRDTKGIAIEGVTALRSGLGAISALRAMRMNERLTNTQYETALKADLPESAWAVVSRNRDDERRHLDFLDYTLATRADELAEHEARFIGLPVSKLILGAGVMLAGLGIAWGIRAWSRGEPAQAPHVEAPIDHWAPRHEVGMHRARDFARDRISADLE